MQTVLVFTKLHSTSPEETGWKYVFRLKMKFKAHNFPTSVKQPHVCCFTYGLGLFMRMLHARVKIDRLNYCRLYLILIISFRGHYAYFDHKPLVFI